MSVFYSLDNTSIQYPVGSIINYSGNVTQATSIAGWLCCDGGLYSTTGLYATLFNIISYTYGGSGTTFNVPNFRDKFAQGNSLPNISPSTTETNEKYLSNDNLPSHSHTAITITSGGAHTHNMFDTDSQHTTENYGGWPTNYACFWEASSTETNGLMTTGGPSTYKHSHTITTQYSYGNVNGNANNLVIIPPYTAMYFLIKY